MHNQIRAKRNYRKVFKFYNIYSIRAKERIIPRDSSLSVQEVNCAGKILHRLLKAPIYVIKR